MNLTSDRVEKAYLAIAGRLPASPVLGIILGSGQGGFSQRLTGVEFYPYREIPYFYQPVVPGHEGILSVGHLDGCPVAVLEGRIHLYEGYFMREITFPVRLLGRMGVESLIICNAAGGISPRLSAGQVMVVSDHVNLMGTNPLIGQIHQGPESPFLNMAGTYEPRLRKLAGEAGRELGEDLPEGVLAAVAGPCYETPAESRMLACLGVDAVTMSSVPEIIMARFLGMRVLGLSLITNVHASLSDMEHGEVLSLARRRTGFLMELITRVSAKIAREGTAR